MEVLYRSEQKITEYEFERIPKSVIEKKFILDFFNSLPIKDLKRLINYKEINYNNKDLWGSPEMFDKLNRLRNERVIQIEANIYLDNGIDDLSLGQI